MSQIYVLTFLMHRLLREEPNRIYFMNFGTDFQISMNFKKAIAVLTCRMQLRKRMKLSM
jgi:hypothetical protein